jgi:hypothetical protein
VDRRLARGNIKAGLWAASFALFIFGSSFLFAIFYIG